MYFIELEASKPNNNHKTDNIFFHIFRIFELANIAQKYIFVD
jgi:hypothetical protein